MTDQLPDPLVPPEVDLRDFGFMPLDVRTLLTSTLWIKAKKDPRVAHAAMSLWCESWHQVPCASLPDDDEVLAEHYRLTLSIAGMLAQHVSRPADVLEAMDELNPDLVLLDLYMPECTGAELARAIAPNSVFALGQWLPAKAQT